jgi:aryl-alcohol dehydrogenase-like predicted oxidoreductase
MYKNKSKICIGCEPLGGHNWGEFEEKKFEKLFSSSYSKGINFIKLTNFGFTICYS